ncbi:hypothetical protein GC173_04010 [bacterium]|nr:hypothetical protein [bacterium]
MILATVLLVGTAKAQDYPSFVYTEPGSPSPLPTPSGPVDSTVPATPAPSPVAPTIAPESTEFIPPPRVLVGDLASTATWTATRARIDPRFETLRMGFLSGADSREIQASASELLGDLDTLVQMAPVQAPNQAESVAWFESRIRRQVELMVRDYMNGENARVGDTDVMTRRSISDLQSVLARSDREREGLSEIGPGGLPARWESDQPELQDFAAMIVAWPTWQLAAEYRERAATYFEYFKRNQGDSPSLMEAREMSALAREMARREYEIPVTSRSPFRNCALQLDVMAESLGDQIRDGRRLHARRQSRVILPVITQLDGYLELSTMTARSPYQGATPTP